MDRRKFGRFVAGAAALATTFTFAGVRADAQAPRRSEHDRIVAFWTPQRVAKAVPRDFVFDPAGKAFKPVAGKPGGGSTSSAVLGTSWLGGGEVLGTTGKVLFALGTSYYVCSASVVDENVTGRSVILTAGHCVFDETNGVFATNWMFIPDYDTKPVALDTAGTFCASTQYGCWTASSLVASSGFTTAGGFNDTAIVHDYAFAVVGLGGKSGTAELDKVVGSQAIAFQSYAANTDTWLFGYPASKKYKGNDLVYSRGPLGFDPNANNTTYRVSSDMTGGSSGGPWFTGFDASTGSGTLMSVNSYGYSGVTAMHGPKLNSETAGMYSKATTMSLGGNIAYVG